MKFEWFRNGKKLPQNRYIEVDDQDKHSRLSFSGVNRSDAAVYKVQS